MSFNAIPCVSNDELSKEISIPGRNVNQREPGFHPMQAFHGNVLS
jgi:hypothetical protein